VQAQLFESTWHAARAANDILSSHHYLGPSKRGQAYLDEAGAIVLAAPTGRHLPADWLELSRWCIVDRSKNAGTRQWGRFIRALRQHRPDVTTLVSYSDPSVGHDGALYRACNWLWAPTWHRLRPPPTGNGSWNGGESHEAVKDRWVFPLLPDARRVELLVARDESILKRMPWARYKEPGGADFKRFRDKPTG
jgi:hypothetical protein